MVSLCTFNEIDNGLKMLSRNWVLCAHLPHDTDWSKNSYIQIATYKSMNETVAITEILPNVLIENCMMFLMREGIEPSWEDPQNRGGGSFSYKVGNNDVHKTWRELTYVLTGGTISANQQYVDSITGITISPKKNFCVIKIWMSNCLYQNPAEITNKLKDLSPVGCIFKKHCPEY